MHGHLAAGELYQFSLVTSQGNSETSSSCLEDTELFPLACLLKRPKRHVGTCRHETCGQCWLTSFYCVWFQRAPKNLASIKELVI